MTKEQTRIGNIMERLDTLYPDATCSLDTDNALQLLISTQLAAQSTDVLVNSVTKDLYRKYRTVEDFANADLKEFEKDIYSTGFYHNKAKNIIACCKMLVEKFNGKVPDNLDQMLELPGVGRKTANLVLFTIYGVPGLIIDTHAKRLSFRLGLTKNTDPEKIEYDLMKSIPKNRWGMFSHQLVHHGRAVCHARHPECDICILSPYCPKLGVPKEDAGK